MDGELYSAPVIQSAIETGSGQITGHFTPEQAMQLANVLQNPLRAPLKIDSSYDVDPTLGRDSIRSGISASFAGVCLVSAFMLCYYLLAGVVANIALVTNIIILLGVMCSIGTTLTLPGIAGVVLTVGMAVDANVLIYERIREELAKGKSLRGAIAAGYARAFGTIFDSHVTTLISSIILIFMGTGEVKGFGVTLTIGVAASLFTALVVTRLIFNFLLDREWIKSLRMFHLIRATKIDFMKLGQAGVYFDLDNHCHRSGLWNFERGSKLFGVDFAGGDSTTFSFAQKLDVEQIRAPWPPSAKTTRKFSIKRIGRRRRGDAPGDHVHRLGRQSRAGAGRKISPGAIQDRQPATGRRHCWPGNPAVGHHRLFAVAVWHPGLCRVPL